MSSKFNLNFIQQFAQLSPDQKGKLGIDNCKALVLYIAELAPKIKEVFQDGKVTFWEALGISPSLVQGVRLLGNLKLVFQEIKDLSASESQQLINELKEVGVFRNDSSADIENRLRHAVDLIYFVIAIVETAQAFLNNTLHADSQKFG